MKTINSKNKSLNQKIELQDKLLENKNSFLGVAELYDEKIYIDTKDGTGYDAVINKLEPLICKLASKYHFSGNTFDDTKQDIIVHILEGIPKYNPNKNMKLSSFLQMRIERRLINELRNKSRSSKNATMLNIHTYNVTCECGFNFIATLCGNEKAICPECNKSATNDTKKTPIIMFEISESMLTCPEDNFDSDSQPNMYEMLAHSKSKVDEEAICACDLERWFKTEDPRIVKIVQLIYLYDYSITAAAKEVGLTGAGANMKLKDLSTKKIVKEVFGK